MSTDTTSTPAAAGDTPKQTVVVLFGGRSSEHAISCATAGGVLAAIDRTRFDVLPVGITREGAFTLQPDDASRFALSADTLPAVVDNGTRVHWPESAESRELSVVEPDGGVRLLGRVDVVFPILHGRFGEDGTVQGLLELVGLPYVGAGLLASSVGMDKHFTKTVLQEAGIAVAPWRTVRRREWLAEPSAVADAVAALGFPVFVKPARAGSSVGVSRVDSAEQLAAAMEIGLAEDHKVLVEAAVVGREIECAVIGGRDGGAPRTSVGGEIVLGSDAFYDFESKYLGAPGADLVCPADLSPDELAEMQRLAALAFESVDGTGLSRVDFFLTDDGWVINEINTMPGFTPISMFPACWLASGLSYPELITELIELGLETER
ncbi:D-alanine--D-alanine ligase family protein [Frigoribacterium faeni]|uniref:D-alanine--D-alanine ligase n=1 Tax=Frigoribacterium faeni TaxID=145483 RepID=A0A7W3JGD0_9MICO|nr:D-alanine--D-alanine ligase family protein [Frigoribacterium faeni]MBA8812377.1 D-alanine-D-alanine ligase [Frigoribacterium faeni]BFF13442.1 D-alanine--D-alanine ligase family protein [Microbacterium flavescens]GEK81910.1 D-alanine--D-alanine ligase [Frigoribacterium faeni]